MATTLTNVPAPASAKAIDLTKLRRPGARSHRLERALAVCRDYVRAQNQALDDQEIELAARLLVDELNRAHPQALDQFIKTAPTSRAPERKGIHEKVEIAAMRTLPETQALEQLLVSGNRGRPGNRALPLAIFECNAWAKGAPEVRRHYHDFLGSDRLLDWAFGYPLGTNGADVRCESSVYSTLNAMLERHDPSVCIGLNTAAIRKLASRHSDIGRYVVVDGTDFPAPVEQRPAHSPAEEALLHRDLGIRLHSHGPAKNWVGWTLLTLTDIKSTLPLVWSLLPLGSGREFMGVLPLIDLLLQHWPDCPIEYLLGDKEFDVEELSAELELRYGIHPITNLRGGKVSSGYKWAESAGVPTCAKHGLMKLAWSEDFFGPKERQASGVPECDLDDLGRRARTRWTCSGTGCQSTATTYPKDNARLYTYLPHKGQHKRVGLRSALLRRRNSVEAVIGELKRRGVGLGGQLIPRWVSSDRQAQWLTGAALLGQTLRRQAHEQGAYERARTEASIRGLVRSVTAADCDQRERVP